jgi:hypothetical protein
MPRIKEFLLSYDWVLPPPPHPPIASRGDHVPTTVNRDEKDNERGREVGGVTVAVSRVGKEDGGKGPKKTTAKNSGPLPIYVFPLRWRYIGSTI